jgi:hypothetical protein
MPACCQILSPAPRKPALFYYDSALVYGHALLNLQSFIWKPSLDIGEAFELEPR